MKRNIHQSTIAILSAFIVYSDASAQVSPAQVIPQLGTVQQQDLDSVRRLEEERRGMRDYQNRQIKEEQKTQKQTKKRKKTTEKANT